MTTLVCAEEMYRVVPSQLLTQSSIELLVIAIGSYSILDLFEDISICHVNLLQTVCRRQKRSRCLSGTVRGVFCAPKQGVEKRLHSWPDT